MADDTEARRIIERWDEMDARRGTWRSHWQDVTDHVMPRKADIETRRSPGEKRTEKQFDGTAADALDELAAMLFSNMTPPNAKWLSMRAVGLDDEQTTIWLDESIERYLARLRQSNFYQQIHEAYIDIGAIGTAGVFTEEQPITRPGFNGFAFRTLPIAEYVIDEDNQGIVDTVIRRFELTARQAVQRWGDEAGRQVVEAAGIDKRKDEKFEFLHMLAPFDDRDWRQQRTALNPWQSVYVSVRDSAVIQEGGFQEMPVHVGRWSLASGEIYGRSPAMKGLPFVRVLNLIVRWGLEALPYALKPPLLVKEGTVQKGVNQVPGGITEYDGNPQEAPRELTTQARFDVAVDREEGYRQRIERSFAVDELRLKDSPQMTAEEVIERRARMQRAIGPMVGRMERELLRPLVDRTWMMMFRAGEFGPPPPQLRQADEIEVVFEGPLARAQRLDVVESGLNTLRALGNVGQVYPEIRDHFDADEWARDAATALGSGKYLRDPEDIEQQRQQRAQQQQAAAQLQGGLQVAETAAKVAGAAPE